MAHELPRSFLVPNRQMVPATKIVLGALMLLIVVVAWILDPDPSLAPGTYGPQMFATQAGATIVWSRGSARCDKAGGATTTLTAIF